MNERRPEESTESFKIRQLRELEQALEEEPVSYDEFRRQRSGLEAKPADTTVIIDKQAEEAATFEQMNRKGINVNVVDQKRSEKKTDTRTFEIGESAWDCYTGQVTMRYVIRNLVEKTNFKVGYDEPKSIDVGQHVKVAALGYKLNGNERVSFVDREDTVAAESLIYQVIRHPDGYLWSEPSVVDSKDEMAGDLLKSHPLSKHLTQEERDRAMIWIQISQIPAEEVIKFAQLHKYGTGTPPKKPEDTQGTLRHDYGSQLESAHEAFFDKVESDKKTPVQIPYTPVDPHAETQPTPYVKTPKPAVRVKKKGTTRSVAGFEFDE
jgi:hypothetical protein